MKYLFFNFLLHCILIFPNILSAQKADSLLNFIRENKDRSSLYLIQNDTVMASLNENKMMPLASTMKIMVALEFAKQSAFRVFDTSKLVALKDLNKYYLPLTDGNAHPNWIEFEKKQGHITNDSISVLNVARGMIMFSSNANTEYLMDLLGLQNINGNYGLMGIKSFTPIFYPVSSLFLYQNPKNLKEEKLIKEISSLSENNYLAACSMIHEQLKGKPEYKSQFKLNDLTIAMQKEWSNRLPKSTTRSYSKIAYVINHRKIFNEATYQILSRVLESMMENPLNQRWISHAGMKGGSTMFVLTKCLYATLKNGNQTELSYFFNNLTEGENKKLQGWMNDFEIAVLSDQDFQKKLSQL